MDYLVHYEDGSSGYLQHYGVKGMKWGVWNSDTASRYRGESVIKKGSQMKRITSRDEAFKNLDLGKPLYVSTNEKDFRAYTNMAHWLPSVYGKTRGKGEAAVLDLVATKNIKVATKKDIEKYTLDKYGKTTLNELYENRAGGRPEINKMLYENRGKTVAQFMKSKAATTKFSEVPSFTKTKGEIVLYELFSQKLGSHEKRITESYTKRDALRKDLEKKGYGAMIDYEDAASPFLNVESPVVLLNPSKNVEVSRRSKVKLKDFSKKKKLWSVKKKLNLFKRP